MPEFTPGPWAVNPNKAQVDVMPSMVPVCLLLWPTEHRSEEETEANAHLIAAAPEMYEACKTALTVTGGSKNWDGLTHGFLVEIEKAVAKAEGRRE